MEQEEDEWEEPVEERDPEADLDCTRGFFFAGSWTDFDFNSFFAVLVIDFFSLGGETTWYNRKFKHASEVKKFKQTAQWMMYFQNKREK